MRTGLLLVNLGSPASPQTADVKSYLREFLSDPHVIEMPQWFWQPLLRGVILPTRSWRSATFYQHIWTQSGSPLVAYTDIITQQVQQRLPEWDVRYAMTYGEPDIATTLQAMAAVGCERTVVLPLFPQYTQSTTQAIIDQAQAAQVPISVIKHFSEQPAYLKILARQLRTALQKQDYDAVLFSYHSIPTAMVRHGDPYQRECEATTAGVLAYIPELSPDLVTTTYQSKFGPAPWLKPYLRNTLTQIVELGKRRVLIITPSFVTDCLETLEEDNVQNYQVFKSSGGDTYQLVPPMNGDAEFSAFLADLAVAHLGGADHGE